MEEDLPRPPQKEFALGGDVARLSVDEIVERIAQLKEEITRLEAELAKKQASRAAADAAFKF